MLGDSVGAKKKVLYLFNHVEIMAGCSRTESTAKNAKLTTQLRGPV